MLVTTARMRWHLMVHSAVGFFYKAAVVAFALSLFSAVAVQKNVRDLEAAGPQADPPVESFPLLEEPYRIAPPR